MKIDYLMVWLWDWKLVYGWCMIELVTSGVEFDEEGNNTSWMSDREKDKIGVEIFAIGFNSSKEP